MPHHAFRARNGQDRASLYDEITDKIIAELEVGRVPWVQPWGTEAAKAQLAMPRNASTDRRYGGINILILWGAIIEHGFTEQSWLTFRQALSLGGPRPQGRARHHGRLRRSFRTRRRETAGGPIRRRGAGHSIPQAVHRLQHRSPCGFDPSLDHESLAGGTRPRSRRHFMPASLSLPFVRVPS